MKTVSFSFIMPKVFQTEAHFKARNSKNEIITLKSQLQKHNETNYFYKSSALYNDLTLTVILKIDSFLYIIELNLIYK